jgi:CubicO group peptidase (beta-lactamase class C family)
MTTIDRGRLREGVEYAGRWIDYQQQLHQIPGVVAAVRFGDELLLNSGYGFANLERQTPMTPQHIFRIASHSKTFTATAIMQLREQGKLRLDDRLGQHIPWLQGRVAEATVRQALNHAAGIIRDGNEADYWQLDYSFPDQAGLQRLVGDGGDILAPNDTFKYSNIAYSLLGLVIEATSGAPYHEYVRRYIVERLGLPDTGPETNEQVRRRLATGYTPYRPLFPRLPLPDVETGAMAAATGFYSTADDLCRYVSAHFLGNEELLSDASKREMQQGYWAIEQDDERYGLGLGATTIGERHLFGHGGGFPGHSTKTWFDPKDRLAVVVLTNETAGRADALASGMVKIIDFALSRSARSDEQRDVLEERYTGRFYNLWGVMDVVRFGAELFALAPGDDDPVKDVTALDVVDESTLRISRTNGYSSPGETMRYVRDDSGKVTRVVSGGVSSFPLEIFLQRIAQLREGTEAPV